MFSCRQFGQENTKQTCFFFARSSTLDIRGGLGRICRLRRTRRNLANQPNKSADYRIAMLWRVPQIPTVRGKFRFRRNQPLQGVPVPRIHVLNEGGSGVGRFWKRLCLRTGMPLTCTPYLCFDVGRVSVMIASHCRLNPHSQSTSMERD